MEMFTSLLPIQIGVGYPGKFTGKQRIMSKRVTHDD